MVTDAPPGGLRRVGDAAGQPVYYDDRRKTYHTWLGGPTDEPVSTTLVLVVSLVRGVDPLGLEELTAAVEPDALDALFDHWVGERGAGGAVSFTFDRCDVIVYDDGEVVVKPTARAD